MDFNKLKESAFAAANFSYAPYSNFHVGAAILCSDGSIFTGCNVENRSYGLTICAERSAVSNAVITGHTSFIAVAVYCMDSDSPVPPCGACRQVLTEFCSSDVPVFYSGRNNDYKMILMGDLYPADSLHDLKNF